MASMLKLILLRHAKSAWTQDGQSDFERRLNERGIADCKEMSGRLSKRQLRPQRIICSSATRATETASLVARELGLPAGTLVFDKRLYLAEPADLMVVLNAQSAQDTTLMLVGHNPGITAFANRLGDGYVDDMPTCCYAEISFEAKRWSDVDWAAGQLVHVDWPKNIVGQGSEN